MQHAGRIRLAIAGDCMFGRLVDQIMPSHVDEPEDRRHAHRFLSSYPQQLKKAQDLKWKYPWGDALELMRTADLRIINLETSVTASREKWPHKAFNYRMHPDNVQILKEGRVDYCSLANNHTLDFSLAGLSETMETLKRSGIRYAGVGLNLEAAMTPAILECKGHRIACLSFSDHPKEWAAGPGRPGINYLDTDHPSEEALNRVAARVREEKERGCTLCVVSIHWGPNYRWSPPPHFRALAHELIDRCGVDLIHGHSSHHVQGIEVYKRKPILYGCGDFVDDYAVDEEYRNDLGFLYEVQLDADGALERIELTPTRICAMSVATTLPDEDRQWLRETMTRLCKELGTTISAQGSKLIMTAV